MSFPTPEELKAEINKSNTLNEAQQRTLERTLLLTTSHDGKMEIESIDGVTLEKACEFLVKQGYDARMGSSQRGSVRETWDVSVLVVNIG